MTKTKEYAEEPCPLVYQCRLPPSTRTVNHLADLLRHHLKAIRSRWRILPPGKIAVIVLAVLRHDQRLADMAGGNNVSESTVRRWRDELITLFAAQAPRLDRALKKVTNQGGEVVLIDGTLIATMRHTGKADRRNYSGKHHRHGLHFLALADERGRLTWISAARPGRTHGNRLCCRSAGSGPMWAMMRSAADLEIPNSGASWRMGKFVRQYAVTSRTRTSSDRLQGRPPRSICGLLASHCGYQFAEAARAQPRTGPYPGRRRFRDHSTHSVIVSAGASGSVRGWIDLG